MINGLCPVFKNEICVRDFVTGHTRPALYGFSAFQYQPGSSNRAEQAPGFAERILAKNSKMICCYAISRK
jgi:hypothetical protein